jgi:hypothetical protein
MKLYLVRLPESRKFIVPKNLKLLAVPLCQVHENHKVQLFKRIRKHQWYLDVLRDQVSAQHSILWKIYLARFYLALLYMLSLHSSSPFLRRGPEALGY